MTGEPAKTSVISLFCFTFNHSKPLENLLAGARGSAFVSIPEECLTVEIVKAIREHGATVLPAASADGGPLELMRLNLYQLHTLGFPHALTAIYPSLRQLDEYEIATSSIGAVFSRAEKKPIERAFVDCPGMTSAIVLALAKAGYQRPEKIQFVLADSPLLDSELSVVDLKVALEACDYEVSMSPEKAGPHGNVYEAIYDYRAVQLAETQAKVDELTASLVNAEKQYEAELTKTLEIGLQANEALEQVSGELEKARESLVAERASRESERASWGGERESLLGQLQDIQERLEKSMDAEQQAFKTNQLSQKITVKSQIDAAELRTRYEERVLEVEHLSSVIEQLQSRLEVAAGLYERLLQASPETLERLGLDP